MNNDTAPAGTAPSALCRLTEEKPKENVMANGRPNYLPDGEELHRLRSTKMSWTAIGERYGTSRQAAQKKWGQWRDRMKKQGVTIENPFPRQTKTVTPAVPMEKEKVSS